MQFLVKFSRKEIGELKALLDLKRRTRGASGGSGVRLGVSLEEAAEFEYLKNILYQYMLGKETQVCVSLFCGVILAVEHHSHYHFNLYNSMF